MPILPPACLAFGTALLLALWPSAVSARPSATLTQEAASWPADQGPYERLRPREGPDVLMPAGAWQAAQRRLRAPDSDISWNFNPDRHCIFFEAYGHRIYFLVTRQSWCLLTDQSIACLNEALRREASTLGGRGLDDAGKLRDYLEGLDSLTLGGFWNLDDALVRGDLSDPEGSKIWLFGREKRLDALVQLCHPLVVSRLGEEVTITYNLMLDDGSVVRRTVHARAGPDGLELLRLEDVEIRPAGTFSHDVRLG